MEKLRKIDKNRIAQMNKYRVLRCLIQKEPINRAAIAKITDLSIPTVMSIIDDLIKKDIVRSIGKGESSGGKPPDMLEVVPDRFYYIGADVGRTTIRVVANNIVSRQIACFQEPTRDPFPEGKFLERLCEVILRVIDDLKTEKNRILGVGIAMPGLIENETGKVLFSPDFGWNNVPMKDLLQQILPYPIMIKNANHALALNESQPPYEDSLLTTFSVNLGYGIGAGIVMGEDLYAGASGTCGEIGHIVVERNGPLCRCGKKGCLEAVASGEAIARQAQEAIRNGKSSKIRELCGEDSALIDAKLVFEAANSGDSLALEIINKAAEYIGIGLSMAGNVLDPDRIVLCGGLMKNGPYFLERIKSSVQEYKMWQAARQLLICTGAGGEYSTANGACRVLANDLWQRLELPI
ncbi:MAG: ROK family transcriptional regulator [Treponema sp.]|jgi:predicted NBD/HSP70 family sugar kinase|nr:ROK family transcriptional regulator [Treponema sp.]